LQTSVQTCPVVEEKMTKTVVKYVIRCRDSKAAKGREKGWDDSMKEFIIQSHPCTYLFT